MRLKKINSLSELGEGRQTRVILTRISGEMTAGIVVRTKELRKYGYCFVSKVKLDFPTSHMWELELHGEYREETMLGYKYGEYREETMLGYKYGWWFSDIKSLDGILEIEDPEDPMTEADIAEVLKSDDIIFDEAEIMKETENETPMGSSPLEKALVGELKKITKKELSGIKSEVSTINSFIKKNMREELVIKIGDSSKELGRVKGLIHENLPHLIKLLNLRFNVLLTGSTGSGKTTGAMQAAEGLGLESYSISVGQQTSKSDIMGFINANGVYVTTSFREAYEHGGVFIMDEIDAGNSNVLIVINSALSNGVCNFPDKKVNQHKDFRFVATANTFGRGRNLSYVGRNALDLATLDRFMTMKWEYSENIEKGIRDDVSRKVNEARKYIADKKIEGFISTRTAFSIETLVNGGESIADAFDTCLYNKLSEKEGMALMSTLFKAGAMPY